MKIATWNVNSLKMRLPHVIEWLKATQTDIVGLQELKIVDDLFPAQELAEIGYGAVWAGQKTYNGVAILYKLDTVQAPENLVRNIPGFDDEQRRLIAGDFETAAGNLRVVCGYFPNGAEVGCDKFIYKLDWLKALHTWLSTEVPTHPKFALMGDFNIAPDDRDVWDPAFWEGNILVSPQERAAFQSLLELGLNDSFRLFDQPAKIFSQWDYRMLGYQKNHGVRIDHILVSDALKDSVKSAQVDKAPRKWSKPSDHAPYWIELG
ncbi:MAG: exodeoxyribonuclease III [Candidatus Aphodousia sp.]|nr:exodeoxyribonuclease III [Candidatus Aphodousia sp.]